MKGPSGESKISNNAQKEIKVKPSSGLQATPGLSDAINERFPSSGERLIFRARDGGGREYRPRKEVGTVDSPGSSGRKPLLFWAAARIH